MKLIINFITKMFNMNKQITKSSILSKLFHRYFDLIFDQSVKVFYIDLFRNSKMIISKTLFQVAKL